MPQTKRLTWAELRVGVMALVAIAILVVLVFLLTGRGGLFRKTAQLRMYFDDAASLKEGAVVRVNGIDAGNVVAVGLSGLADPGKTVEVAFEVRRDMLARIPSDSQGSINPEGVFGDKHVNITRGKSATPVVEGGEIKSLDTSDFQEIVQQSYNTLTSLQGITKRIDNITAQVEKGQGTVGKLLYGDEFYNKMNGVVDQVQKVVASVADGQGTLGKLLADDALFQQANNTMRRVDTVVAGLQAGQGSLGMLLKDPALYQNANGTIDQARKLMENLNAGQGTAGKFLKDEAIYNQAASVIGRADTMLERMISGQGTMGQLLVNRALYDNVTGMTAEAQKLIKDIHENPKKFLRIKLAIF